MTYRRFQSPDKGFQRLPSPESVSFQVHDACVRSNPSIVARPASRQSTMAVDGARYTSTAALAAENAALFRRHSLLAAFGCEIARPGDYPALDIAGAPALLMRSTPSCGLADYRHRSSHAWTKRMSWKLGIDTFPTSTGCATPRSPADRAAGAEWAVLARWRSVLPHRRVDIETKTVRRYPHPRQASGTIVWRRPRPQGRGRAITGRVRSRSIGTAQSRVFDGAASHDPGAAGVRKLLERMQAFAYRRQRLPVRATRIAPPSSARRTISSRGDPAQARHPVE